LNQGHNNLIRSYDSEETVDDSSITTPRLTNEVITISNDQFSSPKDLIMQ
jgi:uncharacterized FlgJ-related protein